MSKEEMLSFYDENLNCIGTSTRSEIHFKGLLHQVVHCWIMDNSCDENWIYFQQRSYQKKDFPGLYDISAAGHIDIEEKVESALKREVIEEIGLEIDIKKLKYIGDIREKMRVDNFYNNELAHVYLYLIENPIFNVGIEVEKMIKISLNDFKEYILESLSSVKAFSVENNDKFKLRREEFCAHEKEYFELIIAFMEKLLLNV